MECRWRGLRSRLADTIQRSIAIDPDAVRASAGMALSNATGLTSTGADDGETTAIIMSLRQKLKAQTDEVVAMQSKLSAMVNEHKQEVRSASHMLFRTVWLINLGRKRRLLARSNHYPNKLRPSPLPFRPLTRARPTM